MSVACGAKVHERPVWVACSGSLRRVRGMVLAKGHHGRGEHPTGEQSPREHRAEDAWQHALWATDLSMEKSLEVGDGAIG